MQPWKGPGLSKAPRGAAIEIVRPSARPALSMLTFLRRLLSPKSDSGAGALGERLAAEWPQRERRFRMLVANWRSPKDRREELDLICEDGDVLVFVEVKARAAGALVSG